MPKIQYEIGQRGAVQVAKKISKQLTRLNQVLASGSTPVVTTTTTTTL